LAEGYTSPPYEIVAGSVHLERLRVSETPSTWAEVSD
jgi:hypothetical protein